jgi:hypothetical protein
VGDDVCGASRSWTGDAIPLALAGARAPTSVCRPRHTGHQSFFASQLEQRSSPTSPRMGSETPRLLASFGAIGYHISANRLIISNVTESIRKTVARRLTTRQHWGQYKQASLLPSVKRLLLPRQLGADEDPDTQSSGLFNGTSTRNSAKKAPDGPREMPLNGAGTAMQLSV